MSLPLDVDVQIMYLVPEGKFYTKEQVFIDLAGNYNRKTLPEHYEAAICKTWAERLDANPKLWNGTKFRIHAAIQDANYNGVTFQLGITDYKEFIGTNWSPNAAEIQELGEKEYGNTQAFMSDALGVGALVVTADDMFVLLRRSEHCAEAPGLLDIPGGHPEPKELVGKLEASKINLADMTPSAVCHEIFESTLREIIDEVNIPREHLTYPELFGIARNTTSAGRPSSEYYVRCSLTSAEIRELYTGGGHLEADESTNIVFVPMATIMTLQRSDIWREMAPSAKGCITLYQLSQRSRDEKL